MTPFQAEADKADRRWERLARRQIEKLFALILENEPSMCAPWTRVLERLRKSVDMEATEDWVRGLETLRRIRRMQSRSMATLFEADEVYHPADDPETQHAGTSVELAKAA